MKPIAPIASRLPMASILEVKVIHIEMLGLRSVGHTLVLTAAKKVRKDTILAKLFINVY